MFLSLWCLQKSLLRHRGTHRGATENRLPKRHTAPQKPSLLNLCGPPSSRVSRATTKLVLRTLQQSLSKAAPKRIVFLLLDKRQKVLGPRKALGFRARIAAQGQGAARKILWCQVLADAPGQQAPKATKQQPSATRYDANAFALPYKAAVVQRLGQLHAPVASLSQGKQVSTQNTRCLNFSTVLYLPAFVFLFGLFKVSGS